MVDTRYTYAVARIRALEKKLLDRPTIERLMNEPAAGVIRVLKETEYGEAFNTIDNPLDFEDGLTNELGRTLTLLESLSPAPDVIRLLRVSYDFHNLKVLLRTKYMQEANPEAISPLGMCPIDDMNNMIAGEKNDVPEYLKRIHQQADKEYERQESFNRILAVIDRACWDYQVAEYQKTDNEFLISLIKKQIDLFNIRSFVRWKDHTEDIMAYIIPQGDLHPKFFVENFTEDWDVFLKRLQTRDYGDIATRGLNEWLQDKAFWKLELAADNHILKFMEKTKIVYFGVEPLIAYFITKKVETNVLRLIFVGKVNNLPMDKIRQRLRILYV